MYAYPRSPLVLYGYLTVLTGPSWSWAALDYTSALIDSVSTPVSCQQELFVTILEAQVYPVGSDAFGPLRGGYIALMGRIGSVVPWQKGATNTIFTSMASI